MKPKGRTKKAKAESKVRLMRTEVGKDPKGNLVIAATDSIGPQVVVKGKKIHLVSQPLDDHNAAIILGKKIVEEGTRAYKDWIDLKKGGFGSFVTLMCIASSRRR